MLLDTFEINLASSTNVPMGSSLAGKMANEKAAHYIKTFKNDLKLINDTKREVLACMWKGGIHPPAEKVSNVVRWRPPIGGYTPRLFTGRHHANSLHNLPTPVNGGNYTNYTKPGICYPS